jgi:hypothetical protein
VWNTEALRFSFLVRGKKRLHKQAVLVNSKRYSRILAVLPRSPAASDSSLAGSAASPNTVPRFSAFHP